MFLTQFANTLREFFYIAKCKITKKKIVCLTVLQAKN